MTPSVIPAFGGIDVLARSSTPWSSGQTGKSTGMTASRPPQLVGIDNYILGSVYNDSGTFVRSELAVSSRSVVALADGRVAVTWTDESRTGGDASGTAIRMQIVDPRDGIVTGTPGADALYGHDLVNDEITAGAGNDVLDDLRGDDALYGGDGQDRLDGGIGADLMYGGPANDTYYVDNTADAVTENPNEGVDTVRTTLPAYTLGANLENLVFIGAGNFAGTGNALANRITGGPGNNTLNGGGVVDTLVAARSAAMTGGAGGDLFLFTTPGTLAAPTPTRSRTLRMAPTGWCCAPRASTSASTRAPEHRSLMRSPRSCFPAGPTAPLPPPAIDLPTTARTVPSHLRVGMIVLRVRDRRGSASAFPTACCRNTPHHKFRQLPGRSNQGRLA